MALNVSEIGFQNTSQEQRSTLASVGAYVSSELSLKTREGDLVNLSFAGEQSLSESLTQTQTQDNGTVQEFSSVAWAVASYSLTVQGDLNAEELAAILYYLLSPASRPLAGEAVWHGFFEPRQLFSSQQKLLLVTSHASGLGHECAVVYV